GGAEARMDGLISGTVLQAGVPMRLDLSDADRLQTTELRPIVESASQLVVPVLAGEEPLAVILAVDSTRPEGAFTADDQELLEALASLGAIAFQTARAFRRERARSEAVAQLRRAEAETELRRAGLPRVVE